MEILPFLFHPFAFQVVGRGKRNFFEGVMVFFLNAFLKARERCFLFLSDPHRGGIVFEKIFESNDDEACVGGFILFLILSF